MTSPRKYRQKPVTVDAMQWDGTHKGAEPIIDWVLANKGVAALNTIIDEDFYRRNP